MYIQEYMNIGMYIQEYMHMGILFLYIHITILHIKVAVLIAQYQLS